MYVLSACLLSFTNQMPDARSRVLVRRLPLQQQRGLIKCLGKTTLLDCLATRVTMGVLSGEVHFVARIYAVTLMQGSTDAGRW